MKGSAETIGTLDLALFALSTLRLGSSTLTIPSQTMRQSHLGAAAAVVRRFTFGCQKATWEADGRSRAIPNIVPFVGDCGVFRMPRYFLHVKRGQVTVLDQEGVELPDIAAAEREATRRAEEIVSREKLKAVPDGTGVIVIADNSHTIAEVPF